MSYCSLDDAWNTNTIYEDDINTDDIKTNEPVQNIKHCDSVNGCHTAIDHLETCDVCRRKLFYYFEKSQTKDKMVLDKSSIPQSKDPNKEMIILGSMGIFIILGLDFISRKRNF